MGDFFAFRRMLMPVLIQIIFWLGFLGCLALGGGILSGAVDLENVWRGAGDRVGAGDIHVGVGGIPKLYLGIGIMVLGPILLRLYCELLMLPFRINATLTDISNTLQGQRDGKEDKPFPSRRG